MKSQGTFVVALLCIAVIAVAGLGFSASSRVSAPIRNFEFTYVTKIPALPADAKTSRIWIPLPQSDAFQAISDLKIESPFAYATHRDSEYGNEYVYLQAPATKAAEPAEVRISFHVARQEHRVAVDGTPVANNALDSAEDLKRFLQSDRRVPLAGTIADLSAEQTRGIQDPM